MDNQSDDRQSDHGLNEDLPGAAVAAPRLPAKSSHAGAVLRRVPPPPGRPQAPWAVAAASPSSVDTVDGKRDGSEPRKEADIALPSNVDTVASNGRPRAVPGLPLRPPKPSFVPGNPSSVDTTDKTSSPIAKSSISMMPRASATFRSVSIPPIPVRSKFKKDVSRTGPSEDRLHAVRENRKQMLHEKALARGRSPGLGSAPSPVAAGKTRSQKTYEDYLRRGESLMARYKRFAKLEQLPIDAIDPVDFVNFCFSLKPELKASAWRAYRQGIRTILETLPHERTSEAVGLMDVDINEHTGEQKKKDDTSVDGARVLPRRSSAKKIKRFPKKDFDRVLAYLRNFARSKYAPVVADWMVAGVVTGLRPIEWAATDLEIRDDDRMPNGRAVWLYVLNAKATNGRAIGVARTIDLSYCSEDVIGAVRRMSENGFEWLRNGEFYDISRQCSQVLYKACESIPTLKGKVYALYSLRHQFIANSKSLYKNEEVSAMSGHLSMETATANYARKSSAWAPEEIRDRARPVDSEVAMVQPRIKYYEQKIKLQQEAGLLKGMAPGDSDDL